METALRTIPIAAVPRVSQGELSALERVVLGIAVLDVSIQVDTYLFYQTDWAELGAIGGVNVSVATFCLLALYALWLAEAGITAAYSRGRALHVSVPLTAYVGIATLSWFVAEEKLLALNAIALLVQSYMLFTYIANRVATRADVVYVTGLLAVSLAIQGAFMIALRIVGHDIILGPVKAIIEDDRVAGTISSPVLGGSFLALMIAPTFSLLTIPVKSSLRILAIVALGLGGCGLLLTFTRGSWIATGMSLSLFMLLTWRRGWLSPKLPMASFCIALVVCLVFHQSIINRVFGDDDGSAVSRIPLYQLAWIMIQDNPLTGVGVNNCAAAAGQYANRPEFRGEWFFTIHNKYLLEWVEIGICGLIAFLCFLVSAILTGWRGWRQHDRVLSPIALALVLAICGQLVHMLVDVFSGRPQVQSLWVCAALIAAIWRIEREE